VVVVRLNKAIFSATSVESWISAEPPRLFESSRLASKARQSLASRAHHPQRELETEAPRSKAIQFPAGSDTLYKRDRGLPKFTEDCIEAAIAVKVGNCGSLAYTWVVVEYSQCSGQRLARVSGRRGCVFWSEVHSRDMNWLEPSLGLPQCTQRQNTQVQPKPRFASPYLFRRSDHR